MDDILELILEIVLEGAAEAAGSKKVPMPLRILLAGIILALFLGIFTVLLLAGIGSGSVVAVAAAVLFLIGVGVLGFIKIRRFIKDGDD